MLRLNNSPIARALPSARSSARVSSLPHSHRKIVRPSSCQSLSCPRRTSFSPHALQNDVPQRLEKAPRLRRLFRPKRTSHFCPLYSLVVLAYPLASAT